MDDISVEIELTNAVTVAELLKLVMLGDAVAPPIERMTHTPLARTVAMSAFN
jgi:hypothetical protein